MGTEGMSLLLSPLSYTGIFNYQAPRAGFEPKALIGSEPIVLPLNYRGMRCILIQYTFVAPTGFEPVFSQIMSLVSYHWTTAL